MVCWTVEDPDIYPSLLLQWRRWKGLPPEFAAGNCLKYWEFRCLHKSFSIIRTCHLPPLLLGRHILLPSWHRISELQSVYKASGIAWCCSNCYARLPKKWAHIIREWWTKLNIAGILHLNFHLWSGHGWLWCWTDGLPDEHRQSLNLLILMPA